MNSPEETLHLTENYLRIIYAGLPVVMCLNVFSGFLYALGNSRTPLLALACATAVNIALDWWFVGSLGLGTNGGAYATVIAQAVSAGVCLAAVLKIPELRPQRVDYRPDRIVIRKLVRLGFPIAFQNLIISLGGLIPCGVVLNFQRGDDFTKKRPRGNSNVLPLGRTFSFLELQPWMNARTSLLRKFS